MERKTLFWPLTGAVLVGFLIGACSRHIPRTNSDAGTVAVSDSSPLDTAAQAQTAPIRNAGDLQRLSTTYADIAKRVTPAVVNINSQQIIPGRVLRDPFGDAFGGDFGEMFREPDRRAQSLGSGVIVDKRGIIITNNHVVQNASSITVTLTDRRRYSAKLVGTDPAADVAVLKIDATNLPVLQWDNSDNLKVGDIVLAIGSPFNLASTVTQGIISAKGRRDLGISAYEDFLQTDAAINPGNSGGALVDIDGNLIGINTAILSESGGNQGIGLAIPSNVARKISGELITTGHVTRGWLGIVVESLTDDVGERLHLPNLNGVLVTGIYARGPAGNLAWSPNGGDVITKVNGQPIDSPGQLRNLVADLAPGSKLSLEVWQDGGAHTFNVTLGRRPARVQGI
ncbi:MAG: trypsin-like peptidase domain-containing protein [Abitibacteriaceae bacterium]|nr:trypsin-like peptidase domain-containing protein [Abditibacteriaceae bacterium]